MHPSPEKKFGAHLRRWMLLLLLLLLGQKPALYSIIALYARR